MKTILRNALLLSLCCLNLTKAESFENNDIALACFNMASDFVKNNSIYASEVNLERIGQALSVKASMAKSITDVYPLVRQLLKDSGDRHASLLSSQDAKALQGKASFNSFGFKTYQKGSQKIVYYVDRAIEKGTDLSPGDIVIDLSKKGNLKFLKWHKPGSRSNYSHKFSVITTNHPPAVSGNLFNGQFGYIDLYSNVPWFNTGKQGDYAQAYQNLIAKLDNGKPCGWIIDLRQNPGGSTYAMLAALGPILGESTAGEYVTVSGKIQSFGYEKGATVTLVNKMNVPEVKVAQAYQLLHPKPPVALLTSGATASAAEAVVVAFRGRPLTKTFGEATFGVPTGTAGLSLPDGAQLIVTNAYSKDRAGRIYTKSIPPDVYVPVWNGFGTRQDSAILAAAHWLATQQLARRPDPPRESREESLR